MKRYFLHTAGSVTATAARACALAALAAAAPVAAGDTVYPEAAYLTGNWGGERDRAGERGIDLQFHYTAQPMVNVAGGERRGGTYTHNIGIDLALDLEKMLGWQATTLQVKFSQRSHDSVSAEYVAPSEGGNTFTVQEIFGGQTYKLANVQLNTRLLDDALELAYGRLVANDDFLRSPLYCQFVNNSFCGSPKAVFLHDPFTFSAYPTAQWGVRARFEPRPGRWSLLAAIYDGDPELKGGDPADSGDNRHGTSWELGDNGTVYAFEAQYHTGGSTERELPGVYKAGGFYMTGEFRDIGEAELATVSGNAMVWLLAERMLLRERPGEPQGLSWFGTLVFSLDEEVNSMTEYFSAGLLYQGLFRGRPGDRSGFAITGGWYSDELNRARAAGGKTEQDYEAAIELNHNFVLGRGIELQPDLQYIIRPAGTGDIDNALLIGAKLVIRF